MSVAATIAGGDLASPPDMTATQKKIVDVVAGAEGRLTCRDVLARISGEAGGRMSRSVKKEVVSLVSAGTLRYVEDCGSCFLEQNYLGRVRLSDNVWLNTNTAPQKGGSAQKQNASSDETEVFLLPGIAFGDCRHPTTRMAVGGLDFLMNDYGFEKPAGPALDIGTGSGILALTMASLGVSDILATDIDPCARKEARDNVCLNQMADRICVSDQHLETMTGGFSLICANLRWPTLKQLAATIAKKTVAGAALVLSGIKKEEADSLLALYEGPFACVWKAFDGGWFGVVFIKSK